MTKLSDQQKLHNPHDDGSKRAAEEWLRTRPQAVKDCMLKYPPTSVVTVRAMADWEGVVIGYSEYAACEHRPAHVGIKVCQRTGVRQIDANRIGEIEFPDEVVLTCYQMPDDPWPREALIKVLGGGTA